MTMALTASADAWISQGPSALVMREYLAPVEGADAPFFPPTFAGTGEEGSAYCIDTLQDGKRVCLVDSVGSQANRMEPLFMEPPYDKLIPQITVKTADGQVRNLCEIGHRAGDAFLRHSSVYKRVLEALETLKRSGDAAPLARVAPTSLVFGVWDSRSTQVKAPRIVSSVIRAYDIDELTRSAQYFPPVDYRTDEMLGSAGSKPENDKRSKLGFNENPSTNAPGGIIARGGIRRDVVVNLAALRRMSGGGDGGQTDSLRRYILGLALVSATCATGMDLRQGCNLTRDPSRDAPAWEVVHPDGKREGADLDCGQAREFAESAANAFEVGENEDGDFDLDGAKKELEKEKK